MILRLLRLFNSCLMILRNIKCNIILEFYVHFNKLVQKYFINIDILILIITYYGIVKN